MVLTTPNVANWAIRLPLLFGRFRYTERGILDRTHAHLFTRKHAGGGARGRRLRRRRVEFTVPVPRLRLGGRRAPRARDRPRCGRRCSPTSSLVAALAPRLISIVIPVKNGGDDLRRCLEAIGRQRVDDDVEIVVVDSGSSDGSAELARTPRRARGRDPAREFNHGATRNLGAGLARRRDARLHSARTPYAGGDRLARSARRAAGRDERVAGVYGRQLAHDDAAAARALLPRLPLRRPAARAGGGRRARAVDGQHAVLERQRGHAARACGSATRSPTTSS